MSGSTRLPIYGRWEPRDGRALGIDRLEVYERVAREELMFTGIVTEVGTVREAREEGDLRLLIGTSPGSVQRRSWRFDRLFLASA